MAVLFFFSFSAVNMEEEMVTATLHAGLLVLIAGNIIKLEIIRTWMRDADAAGEAMHTCIYIVASATS